MSQGLRNDIAVITDTSCFILLEKLNAFPILRAIYSNVITTPEIADEFGSPLPNWIAIRAVSNKTIQYEYSKRVDAGEASAIALALETPNALLILDDLKGRKLAAQLNLKFTGTLGILILAKQQGAIPLLKPYFDKIETSDFRINSALLQEILEKNGESPSK